MTLNIKPIFYYFYALVGMLVIAFVPSALLFGLHFLDLIFIGESSINSILVSVLAYTLSCTVMNRFERFPQKNAIAYILPISVTVFSLAVTVLFILRAQYSIQIIGISFVMNLFILAVFHRLIIRNRHMRFYVVPVGEALSLKSNSNYSFVLVKNPDFEVLRADAVVADIDSAELTSEWERFLAICSLNKISVYSATKLKEAITGKVNVKHLVTNDFGELSPPLFYQTVKRFIDIAIVLLVLPIALFLMLCVAIWINLDSSGGAFFIQSRIGLGGKSFNMVKFRSMYINHGGSQFTEAGEEYRITKVGKIIRKYRLDEIPQFWNVFKGDMSLIGPRPESVELAKWYGKEVPFFEYRHVVRPGISGWAQVMHGYAAGVDDMKDKLSYDFYYIKNFSLWLDLLIFYKTIRTVVTGFGSR